MEVGRLHCNTVNSRDADGKAHTFRHLHCDCGNEISCQYDDEEVEFVNFCSHCGAKLDYDYIEMGYSIWI